MQSWQKPFHVLSHCNVSMQSTLYIQWKWSKSYILLSSLVPWEKLNICGRMVHFFKGPVSPLHLWLTVNKHKLLLLRLPRGFINSAATTWKARQLTWWSTFPTWPPVAFPLPWCQDSAVPWVLISNGLTTNTTHPSSWERKCPGHIYEQELYVP